MKPILVVAVLLIAAPAFPQARVYTNADLGHPRAVDVRPDPAEAVAVLRGSHSIADYTDRHFAPDDGPTFVILRGSAIARPYGEFRRFGPDRRLDGTSYADPPWEQVTYVGGWGGGGRAHRQGFGPGGPGPRRCSHRDNGRRTTTASPQVSRWVFR